MARPHLRRSARGNVLLVLVALLGLTGCALQPIPLGSDTPTPCSGNCPPPQRDAGSAHTFTAAHFRLTYFDPWSIDSSDSHSVVLVAETQLGEVSVEVESLSVSPSTSSAQVLSSVTQNVLDPDRYSGVQDDGSIPGAEIGYVPGSGEAYQAEDDSPNAPSTSVYFEIMASTSGSVGLAFIAISPLDPNSQDPNLVPDQQYDLLVNSVVWS
jgi:hypothetical protein